MQSIQLDLFEDLLPSSSSGKTYPESCQQKTTRSDASWESLLEQTFPCHPEQADGRVRVWLPDQSAKSRGASLMLNISECPNDAVASSLSQVLETGGSTLQKYFLSARACAGILRRAETRGKTLPPALDAALKAQSQAMSVSQAV